MWLALAAALAAALSDGVGSVVQAESARGEPETRSRGIALLGHLLRRPKWLLGTGLIVLTFVLHTFALALAPIAFVQPIILLRLPFAIPLAAHRQHERLGSGAWSGLGLSTGGMALFLAVSDPHGGKSLPGPTAWLVVGALLGGALVLVTSLARRGSRSRRAFLFGTATGVLFAAQALLMRATTAIGEHGFGRLVTSWEPWALGVVAASGLLSQQKAYQAGSFAASRPPLDVVQLTLSILIGVVMLGEHVRISWWALVLEAAGLVAALAGITILARSPLVAHESLQQARKEAGEDGLRSDDQRRLPRRNDDESGAGGAHPAHVH